MPARFLMARRPSSSSSMLLTTSYCQAPSDRCMRCCPSQSSLMPCWSCSQWRSSMARTRRRTCSVRQISAGSSISTPSARTHGAHFECALARLARHRRAPRAWPKCSSGSSRCCRTRAGACRRLDGPVGRADALGPTACTELHDTHAHEEARGVHTTCIFVTGGWGTLGKDGHLL